MLAPHESPPEKATTIPTSPSLSGAMLRSSRRPSAWHAPGVACRAGAGALPLHAADARPGKIFAQALKA